MALIDEEVRATRLARAILADLELYNGDAIAARTDLTEQVTEGAELFRARVTPELRSVFERELATRPFAHLARGFAPPSAPPSAPALSAPSANPYAPRAPEPYAPRIRAPMSDLNEERASAGGSGSTLVVVVAVALVALAGVASFLFVR